jgi:transposase
MRYRLVAEAQALIRAEQDQGWTVLATTVDVETCSDEGILRAYQDQNSTGESRLRWIKNPAAITPMWLEEPERMAALAMLTVVGLLVYSLLQHRVRLYLQEHQQHVPGHKGPTDAPTAAITTAGQTRIHTAHSITTMLFEPTKTGGGNRHIGGNLRRC